MNFKTILSACFVMAFFTLLPAQNNDLNFCGTQEGKVDWLVRYQQNGGHYERSGGSLFLPIKIHIVGNSQGQGYFGVHNLLDAFCTLNNDFGLSDIQFFISGDLHYINNTNFYEHTFQQGNQMMTQNNTSGVINCYIVADPAGNCGYSNYSRGIALSKSCISPSDHTWAHEVGHFLSLPHTFYGWENTDSDFPYNEPAPNYVGGEAVERMDSSNCHYAADGFCDTPPDYLAYRWPCNSDNLSTKMQTDPDSVTFRSDGTLFMSYANDNCSSRFSEEQNDAMHANVNDDRPYLKGQMDPLSPIENIVLNPIVPEKGSTVDFYENVFFEWEPVTNAQGYIVEVSRFANFALTEHAYHVKGTSFVSTDLKAGKAYYWRLRPYNAQYTCKEYSEPAGFFTGVLNGVRDIEEVKGLEVMPNPTQAGKAFLIDLNMSAPITMETTLLTLTGQTVQHSIWETTAGQNRKTIETADLLPGIYFLQLQSEKGVMSRKVVVGK